jgi:hypothetical protein
VEWLTLGLMCSMPDSARHISHLHHCVHRTIPWLTKFFGFRLAANLNQSFSVKLYFTHSRSVVCGGRCNYMFQISNIFNHKLALHLILTALETREWESDSNY